MTRNLFVGLAPLIIGGLLYLTYRVDTLKMFKWFDRLGVTDFILFLRGNKLLQSIQFPNWLKFSLPDALWIFSFTYSMLLLWQFKLTWRNAIWIIIPPLVGLFSEVGQLFNVIPGTFDIMDLLLLMVAMATPFLKIVTFNLKSTNNDNIEQHV